MDNFSRFVALLTAIAGTLMAGPAAAEFNLEGKTIQILVSSRAGGATDTMARLVGKALGRQLPGKPGVVFRNIPGGGGIKALNYFAGKVKPDGMTMLAGGGTAIRPSTLRKGTVRYDPAKFVMIGGLPAPGGVMAVRKDAYQRMINPSAKPVVMGGATGRRGSSQIAVWGPAYLGWNIRWVVGFSGTPAMMMALERGETQVSIPYASFLLDPMRKSGNYVFPAQVGTPKGGKFHPRPDFPKVPVLSDLVKPKLKGKALTAFAAWETMVQVGKWYALAPGTPDDIARIYQAAFGRAVKDKDFDTQAKKQYSPVYTVATGKEMAQTARELKNISNESLAILQKLQEKVGIPTGFKNLKVVKAKIIAVKRGGRRVSFQVKGKTHTVRVSGRRTELTRKGEYIARKELKPGMICEFTYPANKKVAKSITC